MIWIVAGHAGRWLGHNEREIQNFAESQGWTGAIIEGAFGTRVIFQRLKPGAVDY
jgi:hypothetical protein